MELISVHIPKTGGTAFGKLLRSIYSEEVLLLDYQDQIGRADSPFRKDFATWQRNNERRIGEFPREIRAVHGHFWAGKYLPYFPKVRRILWLREPARLLISAYHYWKARPPSTHPLHRHMQATKISLMDFAALPEVQNPVTSRFLKGYGIRDFDFIGIQENFDEDIKEICQWMGWPEGEVPMVNKTESAEYAKLEVDATMLNQIWALNALDVALYKAALRRRRDRRGGA